MINYKEKLHDIKAFVFDFDGVMTDGSIWTYGDNEAVRCGNVKDGYAIQYAVKKGYTIALISGATSLSINNRMEALGVKQIYTGCANKMETYRKFLETNNLQERPLQGLRHRRPLPSVSTTCSNSRRSLHHTVPPLHIHRVHPHDHLLHHLLRPLTVPHTLPFRHLHHPHRIASLILPHRNHRQLLHSVNSHHLQSLISHLRALSPNL